MNNATTDTAAERIRELEMCMAALDVAEEALRKASELTELARADAQQFKMMLTFFELGATTVPSRLKQRARSRVSP